MVPGLELVAMEKQQPLALGAFPAPLAGVSQFRWAKASEVLFGKPSSYHAAQHSEKREFGAPDCPEVALATVALARWSITR